MSVTPEYGEVGGLAGARAEAPLNQFPPLMVSELQHVLARLSVSPSLEWVFSSTRCCIDSGAGEVPPHRWQSHSKGFSSCLLRGVIVPNKQAHLVESKNSLYDIG